MKLARAAGLVSKPNHTDKGRGLLCGERRQGSHGCGQLESARLLHPETLGQTTPLTNTNGNDITRTCNAACIGAVIARCRNADDEVRHWAHPNKLAS
jgi:hypothetical protein